MTFNFILSQIFGLVALLLVCISYSFNSKKTFLFYQILANTFYSASFLCLNVLVGGFNTIISTVRVFVLYFIEKKDKKPPAWLYATFSLLYLVSGIILYQDPLDIIAIISYEIFNLAMFIRNINITRLMMVFPNIMIVIYNLLNFTYTNAILDCVEIIVLIVAVIKFNFIDKNKLKYLL